MSRAFDRFAAALEDAGLTLVDRDLDQGPRVTFADRDDVILFELSWLDASSPCYARTERFNVSARPLRREGGLDEADAPSSRARSRCCASSKGSSRPASARRARAARRCASCA
ncbi:MAG: hypothetical protein M5U28_36555 [Sandaracinaceae bacterium]|nr:hypothetical protein [Sandaracinaceae bacterium]